MPDGTIIKGIYDNDKLNGEATINMADGIIIY